MRDGKGFKSSFDSSEGEVNYLNPFFSPLEVPNWHLQFSNSALVNSNIKSAGNRSIFRLTALFNCFVSISYSSARSRSSITFWPRIRSILPVIFSMGTDTSFISFLLVINLVKVVTQLEVTNSKEGQTKLCNCIHIR